MRVGTKPKSTLLKEEGKESEAFQFCLSPDTQIHSQIAIHRMVSFHPQVPYIHVCVA